MFQGWGYIAYIFFTYVSYIYIKGYITCVKQSCEISVNILIITLFCFYKQSVDTARSSSDFVLTLHRIKS